MFIIATKTSCFDTNGVEFADVLATVSVGNIIENLENISKEIDFFFYLPGNGNKRIDKNKMKTINEISLNNALLLTKNSKNPRFRMVYSLLKEIKKENREIVIIHYIS
jgi:hypothetical protein